MSDESSNRREDQARQREAELQRQVRADRPFSLAEAIGRLAGPGLLKGASPVARARQAMVEIEQFLREHLPDPAGVLRTVLARQLESSELLLKVDAPPRALLAAHVRRVLGSGYALKELVREADAQWGRLHGQRPHFDVEGAQPHPDDPCTIESVRSALTALLRALEPEPAE